jgi:RecB family endonuclease NucS
MPDRDPFETEFTLRDWIAENLDSLQPGLQLISKEYVLPSAIGAGGRVDILARDHDRYYPIEIKKSNKQARETLHELAKYITSLRKEEHLSREEISCFVISTEWHELREALAYFKHNSDVDIIGLDRYRLGCA